MSLTLIIGNKNYSSWSFRPWIAMKVAGIGLKKRSFLFMSRVAANRSCNTRRPARFLFSWMVTSGFGNIFAILEYLTEKFPKQKLWPDDPRARAHARIVATEIMLALSPCAKVVR